MEPKGQKPSDKTSVILAKAARYEAVLKTIAFAREYPDHPHHMAAKVLAEFGVTK